MKRTLIVILVAIAALTLLNDSLQQRVQERMRNLSGAAVDQILAEAV